MRRVTSFAATLCAAWWASAPAAAWAQGGTNSGPTRPDYVFPYLLTGCLIAFGLILVCKPTRRGFEVRKPEKK